MRRVLFAFVACVLSGGVQAAETVRVAVAANFRATLEVLRPTFEATGEAQLSIAAGSTGQLFAQIANGAPFDVFLAADQKRPARLAEQGLAVSGSIFTYAVGRLVMLVPGGQIPPDGTVPDLSGLSRIAIANPRTAPYGAAARQVLERLGVADVQLVLAQNVGGVVALVRSGAAPAGLTAAALLPPGTPVWPVPADLHDPIRQDAALLTRAAESPHAKAFIAWLQGAEAQRIIEANGYALD